MWFNDYGWPVVEPARVFFKDVPDDVGGSYAWDWNRDVLTLDDIDYHGFFTLGYDADQDAFVTTFTAMSEDGRTVWGIRATGQD